MLIAYRVNGTTNNVERLRCTNQDHLMQMLDRWGFQRVLHYASVAGMECAVYCMSVTDANVAIQDMCLAVTVPNHDKKPVRDQSAHSWRKRSGCVHEIVQFVRERYLSDSHPPIRSGMPGIQCTPNGGSHRTSNELGHWCDQATDALTRYHVLINLINRKRKSR